MVSSNKALFFVNSFVGGGTEKVCLDMAEELSRRNISSVFVTCYEKKDNYTIVVPNYIEVFPLGIKCNNKIQATSNMLHVSKILSHNKTWNNFLNQYNVSDFVLITSHLPMSQTITLSGPFANNAIYVIHNPLVSIPKLFSPVHKNVLASKYKDKNIACVCQGLIDSFKHASKKSQNMIRCIYNPISFDIGDGDICKENSVITDNKPYILSVGRLEKEKQHHLAIKAFKVGEFYKTHNLYILGEGSLRPKLNKLIKSCRLSDCVKLLGYQDDIGEWYAHADMLICTSAYEGFNLSIAEALLQDTKVVSFDCDFGPREILTGDLSEFLCVQDDLDELITKMKRAIKGDYPKIDIEYLSHKFSVQKCIDEYLDYAKIINE